MDVTVSVSNESDFKKRVKQLYPALNIEEISLPSKWSSSDKYNLIGLSQNDLKVQYKGLGKTHRDAASVRADRPIPAGCGIYYFETKIISKGRDGYMGIGLSAKGVNLNRLPGWDKQSYGYHGDDGHSFCSSGTGLPYGPTFTTGDVIGCCVNLVDRSCFYTKNGVNIGIAFRDLPDIQLYPMVGLQTPGEEICANFGQLPFVFDIEDYIGLWRARTKQSIEQYDVTNDTGQFQLALHRLVSTYLIHHGYAATAEAFGKRVDLNWGECSEDLTSIKNRQKIQKLVLAGHLGEAIETTQQLFPGLFEKKKNLLFMLKVRQFIEMINGTESEVRNLSKYTNLSGGGESPVQIAGTSSKMTPDSPASSHNGFSPIPHTSSTVQHPHIAHSSSFVPSHDEKDANIMTSSAHAGSNVHKRSHSNRSSLNSDSEMDTDTDEQTGIVSVDNGSALTQNQESQLANGSGSGDAAVTVDEFSHNDGENLAMETEESFHKKLSGGNPTAILNILSFGRDLLQLCGDIKKESGPNRKNKRLLEDAYSLLAYSDPWNSPVGHQLDPSHREPVGAALNSAILESQNLPKTPPLLMAISHAQQCIRKMAECNIGACAFANIHDYLS